jgi:hypothetical protein
MATFRVTYTPVVELPPVRVIEADSPDHAVAQVYPDADFRSAVRVERIIGTPAEAADVERAARPGADLGGES